MRPCDYEVQMPTSLDGSWDLTDSTPCCAFWGQDPLEILMALEQRDLDEESDDDPAPH